MLPEHRKATYDEFLKIANEQRAEYIDGEIYLMASPSFKHQLIAGDLNSLLRSYFRGKQCVPVLAPFDVVLHDEKTGEKNTVQPDITVICDKSKLTNNCYNGVPTLIVEIVSPSNASHDFIRKMNLYMWFGVQEYWIVEPKLEAIRVYELKDGFYDEVMVYTKGDTLKSCAFPNLEIKLSEVFE